MKMVYSNENQFLVSNVKNLIEAQEIDTFIKNEFAQGAAGEISPLDSWPEVWIYNDSDFDRAVEIVTLSQRRSTTVDWICENCSEKNDPSFEICWNCQHEKS
ncbi:MAG: hypothetical protein ACJAZP_003101 [Psychromonas sp.]|jgi:hypothetical protein|uniref:putative signal transducing protein n=1 Tax=Psychromonas sp. TaxID=1884585 RepID=UPI0039E38B1F